MINPDRSFLSVVGCGSRSFADKLQGGRRVVPSDYDNDAVGARFPIEARMDERRIFARFHLDVGIGDAVMLPLEVLECRDWLGFAGMESVRS